ncbi:transcription factor emb1444 [Phtheirospermum japonicum]|uniref:Transcription factor emb1444 n=1 Tax=Phtheirospermum japonicum TaxID=374723 RepID=A0A830CRI8_9LAMI|nr:transcription factor emb1444 [Phtheirospermum japonicum]
MDISFLRPLLQSLCFDSPWNYAVFWKLKHQHEMVLVFEDLHLENSNKILSSNSRSGVLDCEYPVGFAVAEMSSGYHVVGSGVVGKAACTGNASWIHSDNIVTNVFDSVLVPEYPDEWLLQFAAGIKTILLLPVIPHGVLQLGSVEMVAEDAGLVAYVKHKFEAHIKPDGYDLGYSTHRFTAEKLIEDQNAIHTVTTKACDSIANNQMMFQDFRYLDTLESLIEVDFSQQPLPLINLSEPCQLSHDIPKNHHEEKLSWVFEELMNESFLGNEFDRTFSEWDFELHRILGTPVVEDNTHPYTYSMDLSGVGPAGFPTEEVVANASNNSNDNDSSNKSGITSSNVSSGENFASSKQQDKFKYDATRNLSGKQQKRKGSDSTILTTSKRRARAGDSRKPKPRDRQMIQDRLKELRDLVPNSEKCSIDGLLDKTIKHMLFLRNVTKRADRLKHHHKEEAVEKTRGPEKVNRSSQKGTSWAVELGSEQQMCPIVVKDLDHPKHMLIEVVCTDYDRFLEIADSIHRLQLTILEGVMEESAADDSSWARFIVEATGSFHRLDIFWPLMQLVQRSRAPISSKI